MKMNLETSDQAGKTAENHNSVANTCFESTPPAQQLDPIETRKSKFENASPLASSRLGVTCPSEGCSDDPPSPDLCETSEPHTAAEPAAATNTVTGRKRNGAVARLPKELRQHINELLDDNLTYAQIIADLGDAGKHLDDDSIRRWKKGGYQDYLRDQRLLEQCRQRRSDISTLLSDRSHVSGFQGTQQVAAAQICEVLTEFGADFLREALQNNPMNYFRMLNAFSRITNGGLKCERLAIEQQDREAEAATANQPPKKKGLSDEAVAEMKSKLRLM